MFLKGKENLVIVQFIIMGVNVNIKIILQSRKQRPSLSVSVITKIFVLSSLGTTIHLNVYYAGLAYTSATVASALANVIPSLTFLMAVLLRY